MAPFRFRLESVRRLRAHAERRAHEQLAYAIVERDRRATNLERSREALGDAYASARPGDPLAAACSEALIVRRELERSHAEDALAAQDAQLDRSRVDAVEASRASEIVARLESRQREVYRRDLAREEEAKLSELALAAHRRRSVA
jgi:flagellar export protein FliJ